MWLARWFIFCACAAQAADPWRGVFLEREGDDRSGQISMRTPDFHVRVLLYDAATEFRREDRTVAAAALQPGDLLEAWCFGEPQQRCRALRILVTRPAPSPPSWPRSTWGRPEWGPSWPPRGHLLLAGVVAELFADRIRLRTRRGGDYLLRLREDTSLLQDGLAAQPAELRVNMHVFVRAGHGLDGDLEAFQVVWGRILPGR